MREYQIFPDVKIKDNGLKTWWSGDKRVEPYMLEVSKALDESGLQGQSKTTVYNRCYEAVSKAITHFSEETNQTQEPASMDKLSEKVAFYDFLYQGKTHRMLQSQYLLLRAKQLETGHPDDFLDAFRKHMGFIL